MSTKVMICMPWHRKVACKPLIQPIKKLVIANNKIYVPVSMRVTIIGYNTSGKVKHVKSVSENCNLKFTLDRVCLDEAKNAFQC